MFTWSEFTDLVKTFLPVDKDRMNVSEADGYLDKMLRQGVLDVQTIIPFYTKGHETTYDREDLVVDGFASKGRIPEGAILTDGWMIGANYTVGKTTVTASGSGYTYATITYSSGDATGEAVISTLGKILSINQTAGGADYVSVPTVTITGDGTGATATAALDVSRITLRSYNWEYRHSLICGSECITGCMFYISVDPHADFFYVYPEVDADHKVILSWDGKKLDFDDDDIVPFDEQMALVVAEWCRGHIARDIDRDMAVYAAILRHPSNVQDPGGSYFQKRKMLYLAAKDRSAP